MGISGKDDGTTALRSLDGVVLSTPILRSFYAHPLVDA
jgi:hypothetical protein